MVLTRDFNVNLRGFDANKKVQNLVNLMFLYDMILPHCTKKCSFPLRVSLVNLTKSAGNCQFGHIY